MLNLDKLTSLIVVVILGLVVLSVVIGGIFLNADGKTLADALIALAGIALGYIGGLLTPSPMNRQ